MASRDFVADLETITKACTRMFLDGQEGRAVDLFHTRVDRAMTLLTAKPEILDNQPDSVKTRLNQFQFNHYMEFQALMNGAGIKRKGGR